MTKARRKRIERQVLEEIRAHGGMSAFWITETQDRAKVVTEMDQRGMIKLTPNQFPWSDAKITGRLK